MSTSRVLVVDDEADIRALIQDILSDEGYDVTVAADANEARAARTDAEFDLILIPGLYLEQKAFYPPEFFELRESRYVQTGTLGANAVFEASPRSARP